MVVYAGFPSPAEDLGAQRIDLTKVLVTHAQATYVLRASGHSMVEAGIFDNDILANMPRKHSYTWPRMSRALLGLSPSR